MPLEANGFQKMPMAGPYGNSSRIHRQITLSAAAAATAIDFAELPPGTKLSDIRTINDALGASTTMSYGLRYPNAGDGTDSATALLAAAASSSAGVRNGAFHPMIFDVPVIVTGTVGGAAATGKITVELIYEYIGTK